MITPIIVLILVLVSFALEAVLSNKKDKKLGLIIPIVTFIATSIFLIINLADGFSSVEGYGLFLTEYGSRGLFAFIFRVGFLYSPVAVQLAIYFIFRHRYKKQNDPLKNNKELKKMIVDDLN